MERVCAAGISVINKVQVRFVGDFALSTFGVRPLPLSRHGGGTKWWSDVESGEAEELEGINGATFSWRSNSVTQDWSPTQEAVGRLLQILMQWHQIFNLLRRGDQAELQLAGPEIGDSMEGLLLPGVEIEIGRAHQLRCLLGSYAAHGGGRWAVSSGDYAAHGSGRLAVFPSPLLLLVEGRPSFLLADEPIGRQFFFLMASVVLCHGSFVVPSGVVPGGDEVLVGERIWTRLRSPSGSWGPFCKRQGLVCNFLFPLELFVRCNNLS